MKRERRAVAPRPGVELRVEDSPSGTVIRGYGAVFNSATELWPGFEEVVRPGAFDKTLAEQDDVRSLVEHLPQLILGRRSADTLELGVDDTGLWYRVRPPETRAAKDIVESIRRGDVDGSSFGFSVLEGGETYTTRTEDGVTRTLRELLAVRLYDVGPVAFPAYTQTTAGVRAELFQRAQAAGVDPGVLEAGGWDLRTGERIAAGNEAHQAGLEAEIRRRLHRQRQRRAELF